jgi:hypothetical protein
MPTIIRPINNFVVELHFGEVVGICSMAAALKGLLEKMKPYLYSRQDKTVLQIKLHVPAKSVLREHQI